jgi:hypothetical protein
MLDEGRISTGKLTRSREYNIKMGLQKLKCYVVEPTQMAQDMFLRRALKEDGTRLAV